MAQVLGDIYVKDSNAKVSNNFSIVEKTLCWLEKEDSDFEKLVGYGVSVAATTYFVANLFQYIIF